MPNSRAYSSPNVYVPPSVADERERRVPELAAGAVGQALEKIEDYARREPLSFAAWAFGIGFVLGWRLKPW